MGLNFKEKLALVTASIAGIDYAIAASLALKKLHRPIVSGRSQSVVDSAIAQLQIDIEWQILGLPQTPVWQQRPTSLRDNFMMWRSSLRPTALLKRFAISEEMVKL